MNDYVGVYQRGESLCCRAPIYDSSKRIMFISYQQLTRQYPWRIIATYPKHFDGTFDCSDSSTDGTSESANSLNSEDKIDAP
jgi:hypothetical protein